MRLSSKWAASEGVKELEGRDPDALLGAEDGLDELLPPPLLLLWWLWLWLLLLLVAPWLGPGEGLL